MQSRRGMSLIECAAMVLVLSMIGMTVGPSLEQVRAQMRGAGSAANLMSMGQGGAMYAGANNGRIFSYSWRAGETYVMPDGRPRTEPNDTSAAGRQNTEILQRMTGRIAGVYKIHMMAGRLPHRRFQHLVLMDFLNQSLDTTKYIDPSDGNLLFWHQNPLEYREDNNTLPYGNGMPDEGGYDTDGNWLPNYITQRWTYSSSYQAVPSSWQPEYPNTRYVPIDETPHLFAVTNGSAEDLDLHSGRQLEVVLIPSRKVWMFEEFDREQAGSPYFAYNHARTEKLMFDGSVNSWSSGDAFPSVVPERGVYPERWSQTYVPLDTFPVPLGGLGDPRLVNQRFRWTYRGLYGIDYGPLERPGRGPQAR